MTAVKEDERGKGPGPVRLDETALDARPAFFGVAFSKEMDLAQPPARGGAQEDPGEKSSRHAREYIATVTRSAR